MSASYNPESHTLEFKLEAALKKFLMTAGLEEALIFTGETIDLKQLPAVICKCLGGPEDPPGSNSYLFDATVCIVSSGDESNSGADPLPPHRRRVKEVRDALWNSKVDSAGIEWLHSYLSCQIPYFSVMREISHEPGIEDQIQDRKIYTELRFKMACNEMPGKPDAIADFLAGRLVLGDRKEDVALLHILAN